MKKSIWVLIVLLALLPSGLVADDLYTGEAVVEFGELESADAFRRALAAVLLKQTGNPATARDAALLDAAGDPESIALSYQYREVTIPLFGGEPARQRRLVADFDPPTIDRLLADVPRWGRFRPKLLVWLVLDFGDGEREFLPSDADWLHFLLEDGARQFGLELEYPLMMIEDMVAVSVEDVRAGRVEGAMQAVDRYGTDGVLLADIRYADGQWTSRWRWRTLDDEAGQVSLSGQIPERVVEHSFAQLATQLARAFSTSRPPPTDSQKIAVSGLGNERQYFEVLKYLNGLRMVDRVRVAEAEDDRVVFLLDVNARGLDRALTFSRLLTVVRPEGGFEDERPGDEFPDDLDDEPLSVLGFGDEIPEFRLRYQ